MIRIRARAFAYSLGVAAALLVSAPVQAQGYPNKPVRLVVPFPGGSLTDTFMRVFSERMQGLLGQPIIVDPRAGGGTVVGTLNAIQQPPDGYTMLLVTASQEIRSAQPSPPFDIRKDVSIVSRINYGPLIFAVNVEQLPNVKSMKDFIAFARSNPGKLNIGTYGVGSVAHLALAYLTIVTGINLVHVPYNGSAADVLALTRGDSHAAVDAWGTLRSPVEQGKVRTIALTTAERFPLTPDIPGMKESGVDNFDLGSTQGLGVPAGAPSEVVDKLNAAAVATTHTQSIKDYFAKVGNVAQGSTPEEYTAQVRRNVEVFQRVIREAKITIE